MLGVGSSILKGGKILTIIKNGLQAWYKADKTQAPLGEEEITNGDFNLGSDIIGYLPTFFDDTTYFSHANGLVTISSEAGVSSENNAGFLEHSKTYKVTVDVVTLAGINPRVYLGGTSSDTLVQGVNVKYVTTDGSADHVGFNDAQGTVFRSYTVEKTNPNDSWKKTGDTIIKDGTALIDSGLLFQSGVMVNGKKYRLELDVSSLSLSGSYLRLQDNSATASSPYYQITSDGHHTVDFTWGDTHEEFQLAAGSSASAVLSNITLKEITNSVKDFSPNVNNGVLYSGKALSFDGSADYIDIDYWKSKTIDANTKATFAVWFNDDNVSSGDYIFGTNTSASDYFYLGVIGGKLELGWHDSGWQADTNSIAVADDTWYRAVAVIDGYTCRVYLNGELAFSKTTTSDFTLHATGLSIGAQGDNVGDHWDGDLADFQIYDKAWTPSDVTYDYNNPDKDVFDDEGRAEVLGEELVSNGDFTNNITDWNAKDSTISYDNGKLKVSGTLNASGGAFQNIGLVTGKYYKMTATIQLLTGSSNGTFTLLTSTSTGTSQTTIYTGSTLVVGGDAVTETFIFTPGSNDVSIQLSSDESNASYTIDNISVKEVLTHTGEISPTNCTALYRLNEGAGNRVYNAAPVLGDELLPAISAFTIDSNDTDEISIVDGNAVFNSSSIGEEFLAKSSISNINTNGFTEVSVTVENYVSGSIRVYFGNPATGIVIADGNGTFKGIVQSDQNIFYIQALSGGFEGTITAVSAKEITLPDSYVQTSWVSGNWKTAQPYIPQYAMSSYSKKMIFDGSNDYVALGSEKTIAAADAFSLSFWYYNIDTSNSQIILGKDGSTDDYLSLGAGDESLIFKAGGSSKTLDFNSDLTAGKLNHITLTSPGGTGTMKSYINGVLQTNTQTSLNADFDYAHIFRNATDYGEGFIDELAHFSKELSVTEVQEIFNAGMALDCRDHSAYLGSEEFDDPGFDDPSEWGNLGTGKWVVSGGKASVDSSGTVEITQTLSGVTAGKIYDISFEISDYSHGSFQFAHSRFHEVETSASIPNVSGNGTYSYRTIAQGSDPFFMYLYAYGASKFSIDNISVKEVDLKGYWRNNGAETWTDLSPYGNDGTVNGSPITIQLQEVPYFKKDTFGLPMNKVRQKGLNLDGDSYVKIDDHNSLDFNDQGFTIQFWAKPNSIASNMRMVTKGVTGNSEWMISFSSTDEVRVFAKDSDGNFLDTSTTFATLSVNTWAMVTAVVDTPNDKILFYKDNQSTPTQYTDAGVSFSGDFNNTRPLMVGDHYASSTKFDGVIDDVKVYNTVLSSSDVSNNYKATKSKHKDNTVSSWSDDFDDGFI